MIPVVLTALSADYIIRIMMIVFVDFVIITTKSIMREDGFLIMMQKNKRKTNKTLDEIIDSFVCPVRSDEHKIAQEKRRISNEAIRVYNRASSMHGNPFAGDTTVLDKAVDNRRDSVPLTMDEIIDSVQHPRRAFRVKRNLSRLMPDVVSPEVRQVWLEKIHGSRLRGAKSLKEKS
jgi:hypothetical protein